MMSYEFSTYLVAFLLIVPFCVFVFAYLFRMVLRLFR